MPDFHLLPGPPSPLLRANVERFVDQLRRPDDPRFSQTPVNCWFADALRERLTVGGGYIDNVWFMTHEEVREATIVALASPVITVRTARWADTAAERNAWLDEVWARMGYDTPFPDELRVQRYWTRRAVRFATNAYYTRLGRNQTEILHLGFHRWEHSDWYGTPLSMPMREFR